MPVVGRRVFELVDGAVLIMVVDSITGLGAEHHSSQSRVGVDRGSLVADDPVALAVEQAGAHVAVEERVDDVPALIDVEYRRPQASVSGIVAVSVPDRGARTASSHPLAIPSPQAACPAWACG